MDYLELKKGGFIKERRGDRFSVRLRVPVGILDGNQLTKLREVAESYGEGFVHVTHRQGIEIPGVRFGDLKALQSDLALAGLTPGSCGSRVRNIPACPGLANCTHALVDSRALGRRLDELFVGRDYSVKIKIAVSGCPNSCTTPQINDIGFVGVMEPALKADLCDGCALCVDACKEKAIAMRGKLPQRDVNRCIYCGDCVASCPTGAWTVGRMGYTVYVGGKIGRHPQLGSQFAQFVSAEDAPTLVARILAFTSQYGAPGERLGSVLARTGIEALREYVDGKGENRD